MSEMKHTPGPWTTETDLPFGEKPRVESNDKLICEVGNAEPPQIAQDEWEANARLIAAAPEMLEALQEVKEAFSPIPNSGHNSASALARRYDALKKVSEVIARSVSLPLSKGQEEGNG